MKRKYFFLFTLITITSMLSSCANDTTRLTTDAVPHTDAINARKGNIKLMPNDDGETRMVAYRSDDNTEIQVAQHQGQYAIVINSDKPLAQKQQKTIAKQQTKKAPKILASAALPQEEFTTKGNTEVIATPSNSFDITNISASYLLGKFNPATHSDFTKVNMKHTRRKGIYIRKDTYVAFMQMYEAALEEGIRLNIISATRSFSSQKSIWEAKWTGRRKVAGQNLSKTHAFGRDRATKILEFSAMPGTSRHHWGTDLDLCALNNRYFTKGKGKKIYQWLSENAATYGFHQPYTERSVRGPEGHNEEKWHWSYTPVSVPLTRKYIQLLDNHKITGFKGQESAPEIQIIEKYVLSVNPDCK